MDLIGVYRNFRVCCRGNDLYALTDLIKVNILCVYLLSVVNVTLLEFVDKSYLAELNAVSSRDAGGSK
jgi:hypothetical protein